MEIDDYERDNLYWLLLQCRGSAADTGDWLGQCLMRLEARGASVAGANEPDTLLRIDIKE